MEDLDPLFCQSQPMLTVALDSNDSRTGKIDIGKGCNQPLMGDIPSSDRLIFVLPCPAITEVDTRQIMPMTFKASSEGNFMALHHLTDVGSQPQVF